MDVTFKDVLGLDGGTIEAVGFDLDDCLYKSTETVERELEAALGEMKRQLNKRGVAVSEGELILDYGNEVEKHDMSSNGGDLLDRVAERYVAEPSVVDRVVACSVDAYHQEKFSLFSKQGKSFSPLYADVIPFLKWLDARGIKKCIITDGLPKKQYAKIHLLGLDDFFEDGEVLVSGEEGLPAKPSKRIFEEAADAIGVEYASLLFVDDRSDKMEGARELGIKTVRIRRRGGKYASGETHEDDGEVESLEQLRKESIYRIDGSLLYESVTGQT